MFGWLLKMLLKVMKPFAGIALIAMILGALESVDPDGSEDGSDDPAEDDPAGVE